MKGRTRNENKYFRVYSELVCKARVAEARLNISQSVSHIERQRETVSQSERQTDRQTDRQLISHSVTQTVSLIAIPPVSQAVRQSISQPFHQSVSQSINQSISQSVRPSVRPSVRQSPFHSSVSVSPLSFHTSKWSSNLSARPASQSYPNRFS